MARPLERDRIPRLLGQGLPQDRAAHRRRRQPQGAAGRVREPRHAAHARRGGQPRGPDPLAAAGCAARPTRSQPQRPRSVPHAGPPRRREPAAVHRRAGRDAAGGERLLAVVPLRRRLQPHHHPRRLVWRPGRPEPDGARGRGLPARLDRRDGGRVPPRRAPARHRALRPQLVPREIPARGGRVHRGRGDHPQRLAPPQLHAAAHRAAQLPAHLAPARPLLARRLAHRAARHAAGAAGGRLPGGRHAARQLYRQPRRAAIRAQPLAGAAPERADLCAAVARGPRRLLWHRAAGGEQPDRPAHRAVAALRHHTAGRIPRAAARPPPRARPRGQRQLRQLDGARALGDSGRAHL